MINSEQWQMTQDKMVLNISSPNRENEPFRLNNEQFESGDGDD
jgi:hypothetical protein